MEKKDKKKANSKPSRIARITSPKAAAKPKKSSSLSPAMATWARSNRKMIEKSGTKKQRAMLAKLDGGTGPVKSGAKYARSITKGKPASLPTSARNTSTSSTPKVNTPVQTSKPKPKPDPQANISKDGKRTGTYGKSLPSNPQLKNNTNRRRSSMVKGQMVGEDVKPLSKTEKRRKAQRGTPAKRTSLTIKAAGSSTSRNRLERRRRGR